MKNSIERLLHEAELMDYSDEKRELTENLFHISNWNLMDLSQRVRLFQLLENNLAYLDLREPSKIVLVPKLDNVILTSMNSNDIFISQYHLLQDEINGVKDINAFMYHAIVSEHEHINQFINALDEEKRDQKTKLIRKNLGYTLNLTDEKNICKLEISYIRALLQPIVLLPFKDAEFKTKKVFRRLEKLYGKDEGYQEYCEDFCSSHSTRNLVNTYNLLNNSKLSFKQIYQGIINEIDSNFDEQEIIKKKQLRNKLTNI